MCLSRASMCNQMLTNPTDAQTTKPFPTQYDDMSRFVVLLQITKNDKKHPKRTEKSLERPKDSRPSQSLPKASQKPPKSLPNPPQNHPQSTPRYLKIRIFTEIAINALKSSILERQWPPRPSQKPSQIRSKSQKKRPPKMQEFSKQFLNEFSEIST